MDFRTASRDHRQARRARRLHRGRDQAARTTRAHAVLRPPARDTRAPTGRTTAVRAAEWRALIERDGAARRQGGPPAPTACRRSCGGQAASNLAIAAIREHLAAKGLGLHNDLQDESSIVGNFPIIPALAAYGTREQKLYIEGMISGKQAPLVRTRPNPATAATRPGSRRPGVRDGDHWVINGMKRWNSQVARAHGNLVFARTSGKPGDSQRHHRLHRADRHARPQHPLQPLDLQHAERSRGGRS